MSTTTPHSVHRRVYDCEAFEDGPDRMRVRGHLNDTKPLGLGLADGEPMVIHDMSIELIVTLPSFTIVDVIAQMHVHPYDICPAVLADYRQLIGRSVTRGYSKAVRELFGGPQGCSHLGALLQAMGPVAVQASWGMATLHEPPGAALRTGDGQNQDGEEEGATHGANRRDRPDSTPLGHRCPDPVDRQTALEIRQPARPLRLHTCHGCNDSSTLVGVSIRPARP